MTREIKFRAWDTVNNRICTVDDILFARDGLPVSVDIGFSNRVDARSDEPQAIIMQYTGLLDKNGVEIYEGDVVEYEAVKGHIGVHQVIYEPKAAAFLLQAITRASRNPIGMKYLGDISRSNSQYDTRTYELCEVIGNIYANPELLKEVK